MPADSRVRSSGRPPRSNIPADSGRIFTGWKRRYGRSGLANVGTVDHEAEQLLEREGDLLTIKRDLWRELARLGRSRTLLNFNVTNVCLDFDGGAVTTDDELWMSACLSPCRWMISVAIANRSAGTWRMKTLRSDDVSSKSERFAGRGEPDVRVQGQRC